MQDRLNELHGDDERNIQTNSPRKELLPAAAKKSEAVLAANQELNGFLQRMEDIRNEIQEFETVVVNLKHCAIEITTNTTKEEHAKTNKQAEDCIQQGFQKAKIIKKQLEDIDRETKAKKDAKGNTAENVISFEREQQKEVVLADFMNVLKNFSIAKNRFTEVQKESLTRLLKIVSSGDITQQEINEIVDNPGNAESVLEDVFAKRVLISSAQSNTLRSLLAEESETRRHLLELEKDFKELQQMFVDFGILVNQQGYALDSVQKHVEMSNVYVESGIKEIGQAHKTQKKSRKAMLVLLLIVICIFIFFVVFIVLTAFGITGGFIALIVWLISSVFKTPST